MNRTIIIKPSQNFLLKTIRLLQGFYIYHVIQNQKILTMYLPNDATMIFCLPIPLHKTYVWRSFYTSEMAFFDISHLNMTHPPTSMIQSDHF